MKYTKALIDSFQRFAITDGRMPGTAISAVIKALEKQVKAPVKFEDIGCNHYHKIKAYAAICPRCGVHLIEYASSSSGDPEKLFKASMNHHDHIGINSYCTRCGQRLEWGSYR